MNIKIGLTSILVTIGFAACADLTGVDKNFVETGGTGAGQGTAGGTPGTPSSSSSSSSGGGVCQAGSTVDCQTGLLGPCAAGSQTCNAGGTGYGACTPASAPAAGCPKPGDAAWGFVTGDTQPSDVRGVAVDPQGNVLLSGVFSGSLTLPNVDPQAAVSLTAPADTNALWLAKLDPAGNALWGGAVAGGFGAFENVVTDPSGDLMVVGSFAGSIDFGGGAITGANPADSIFAAKLDASGALKWVTHLDSSAFFSYPPAASGDGKGNLIVLGGYGPLGTSQGSPLAVPLAGGGTAALPVANTNLFVTLLTDASMGKAAWVTPLGPGTGSTGSVNGDGVSTSASGDTYVSGVFNSTVDLGGVKTTTGGQDIFLARLDATGRVRFGRAVGTAGDDRHFASAVAADKSGGAALAGDVAPGSVDFGGGAVTVASHTSFVAKYDAANKLAWVHTFSGDASVPPLQVVSMTSDDAGDLYYAAIVQHDIDLGGGLLNTGGKGGVVLAKFAPGGALVWSKAFGSPQDNASIAPVPSSGGVVFGGACAGKTNFGTGLLTSPANTNACVAEFYP